MKKLKNLILIISMVAGIFASGCKNNTEIVTPNNNEPTVDNPADNPETPINPDIPTPADISERAVYVGETTETVDGITYTVKAYAIVYGSDYIYEYYKYYYLNDKLAEVRFFDHRIGAKLDYKYTEFVEHSCSSLPYSIGDEYNINKKIVKYYESGLIKSISMHYNETELIKYSFYNDSKNSLKSEVYSAWNDGTYFNESGTPLITYGKDGSFHCLVRYDSGFVKNELKGTWFDAQNNYKYTVRSYNDGKWKDSYRDRDNNYVSGQGNSNDCTSERDITDPKTFIAEQVDAFETTH